MEAKRKYLTVTLLSAAFILCTVFNGGMYWQHCIIPIALLLICCLINFKDLTQGTWLIGLCSIALTVLALLSLISTRGNFQNGVYECEKLLIFILALYVGKLFSQRQDIILRLLVAVSLIISIGGILAYCSIITPSEFIFPDGSLLRLQSFIKYANTTACLLGSGYYSLLELEAKHEKVKALIGAVILMGLWLTFSKACIPMFLAIAFLIISAKRDCRGFFIIQNVITAVFSVLTAYLASAELLLPAFISICIGIALSSILTSKIKRDLFKPWTALFIIGIIAGVVLIIIKPSIAITLFKRWDYSRDALSLIPDSILLGNGPASWRLLQFTSQTTDYFVTLMHNGPLQFAVEMGIPFTVIFFAVIIFAVIRLIKARRLAATASILLTVLHSSMDLDLSFGVMLMTVGLLSGTRLEAHKTRLSIIPLIPILLISALTLGYMSTEYIQRSSFENLVIAKRFEEAYDKGRRLEAICPRDPLLQVTLATLEQSTSNDTEIITARLKRAVDLSPLEPSVYNYYMNYTVTDKSIEEHCAKYQSLMPLQKDTKPTLKAFIESACQRNVISSAERDRLLSIYVE